MMLDRLACDRARRSRDARFDGRFFIGALDTGGVDQLADRLGLTARHLRRLFVQHLGATPLQVALTRRAHFAKKLIDETRLPFGQVAIAAGFGSLRRFNAQIKRTYKRTPGELRRLARQKTIRTNLKVCPHVMECYRFRLSYRPPYDWDAILAFLSARATPGVESVTAASYRRTITAGGQHGSIAVSHSASGPALDLEVRFPDPRSLLLIVERVRRIFDLGADPAVIAEHLGADPLLRKPMAAHPGLRTPGAWDPFELSVRAIIGQQISVRGATTMAGRVAAMFGAPAEPGDLDRLFPTPVQLSDAPIERAGLIPARAQAIRALAQGVLDGSIALTAGTDTASLTTLPGIGDWTAQYIAMRAFGEPDAFPSGDLILRRAAGCPTARALERRSESWRPWRAYAVMLLWQAAGDERTHSRRTAHAQATTRSSRPDGARRLPAGVAAHGAG